MKKVLAKIGDVFRVYFPKTGNDKSFNDRLPFVLFIVLILSSIVYQLLMQPLWLLKGEMWAEMATNYYANSFAPTLIQKLFSTDCGYIPFPQRLIALAGDYLHLSPNVIPYYYTWSAVVLVSLLVGVFCLKYFRSVVENDLIRFFICMVLLIVCDFETKTFINFTYYVVFFSTIVIAAACFSDKEETPIWMWLLPVLLLSKPYSFTVIPLLFCALVVCRGKFRIISIVSLIVCSIQFLQLVMSYNAGVFPHGQIEPGLIDKMMASVLYFFGLLGGFVLGPTLFDILRFYSPYFVFAAGCVIVLILFAILFFAKSRENILILFGMIICSVTVLINCFAISFAWNTNMGFFYPCINRYTITFFFGSVLVVAGIVMSCSALVAKLSKRPKLSHVVGVILFLFWFFASGWGSLGFKVSKELASPALNNSYWQANSACIDSDTPVLSVPVDPFGWVYTRNCMVLNSDVNWQSPLVYKPVNVFNGESELIFTTDSFPIRKKSIVAMGILLKTMGAQACEVTVKAELYLENGHVQHFFGSKYVSQEGGMVHIIGDGINFAQNVVKVKLKFNVPVSVAYIKQKPVSEPAVLWIGI